LQKAKPGTVKLLENLIQIFHPRDRHDQIRRKILHQKMLASFFPSSILYFGPQGVNKDHIVRPDMVFWF
jgi:hypothetical protein